MVGFCASSAFKSCKNQQQRHNEHPRKTKTGGEWKRENKKPKVHKISSAHKRKINGFCLFLRKIRRNMPCMCTFSCLISQYIHNDWLKNEKAVKKKMLHSVVQWHSFALSVRMRTVSCPDALWRKKTSWDWEKKCKEIQCIFSLCNFFSSALHVCASKKNERNVFESQACKRKRKWRKQLIFCTVFAILFPFSVVNGSLFCEWNHRWHFLVAITGCVFFFFLFCFVCVRGSFLQYLQLFYCLRTCIATTKAASTAHSFT